MSGALNEVQLYASRNDITKMKDVCSDIQLKFFICRLFGRTKKSIAEDFGYSAQGVTLSINRVIHLANEKARKELEDCSAVADIEPPSYESMHIAGLGVSDYTSYLISIAKSLSK